MRVTIILAVALAGLSGCQPAGQEQGAPAEKPAVNVEIDVPEDRGAQLVTVVTRDIPAGGEVPWHTHPGVEIAYVERGEVELWTQGKGPRRLEPGENFIMPRGMVHGGANIGDAPARLVITYVVDKDAPLRTPAEAPED